MEESFEKTPSLKLFGFIEQLVQKYQLEDYRKEPDINIREAMLSSKSFEDIGVLKSTHADDTIVYYPYSKKLWYILKDIINKKIDLSSLSLIIEKELLTTKNISESMATEIASNAYIKEEIMALPETYTLDKNILSGSSSNSKKRGGIAQELA